MRLLSSAARDELEDAFEDREHRLQAVGDGVMVQIVLGIDQFVFKFETHRAFVCSWVLPWLVHSIRHGIPMDAVQTVLRNALLPLPVTPIILRCS